MATGVLDNVLDLDVPVHEVTLLEDRARVVRRGSVSLPEGAVKVRIDGVAPVLADKTLTGEVFVDGVEAAAARVADVRVRRRLMVARDEPGRPVDAKAADLEAEGKALESRIDELEAERLLIERHAAGLDQVATSSLSDLSRDVSWGGELSGWSAKLDDLGRSERELRESLVAISSDIEELRRTHQRLQERLAQTKNPAEREWAAIEADLVVTQAGAYELVFEYVVPCACWRPYHTARLTGGELVFTTDACIWQNTGEDWRDVKLVLSTERASLGTSPPVLGPDILSVRRKSDEVVVEAREQEIQTTGLGAGEGVSVAPELPGIDDGGAALHLVAPRLSAVPSDGRPYRVFLQTFTCAAEVELVSMPELAACVFFKSVQTNAADTPILAGPVDLIRHSGLAGRTSVLFIAAGERFELGWGPEPDLRLKRDTEVTEDKSRFLSSWVERSHEVEIRLSNLGDREHVVRVTERVPVSEIDKVKIEVDAKETTGGKQPDASGMLTWTVTLPPRGHQRIALSYALKKHEDVRGI